MSELIDILILLTLLNILWVIPKKGGTQQDTSIDIDWAKWGSIGTAVFIIVISILTYPILTSKIGELQQANPSLVTAPNQWFITALPYVFLSVVVLTGITALILAVARRRL